MAEDDESNNVVLNEYELSNGFRSHSFGNYLSPKSNMTCLLQLSVKKRIVIIKLFDGMDNNSLFATYLMEKIYLTMIINGTTFS